MKDKARRTVLYLAIPALYLLHNDLWWWDDPGLFLGLPIGLSYHILFCVVTSLLMGLLIHYAWPSHLDDYDDFED